MNIGIDIDGVLTDLENYIGTVGKEYINENGLRFDDTMNPNTIYGFLSKEDSHRFWDTLSYKNSKYFQTISSNDKQYFHSNQNTFLILRM